MTSARDLIAWDVVAAIDDSRPPTRSAEGSAARGFLRQPVRFPRSGSPTRWLALATCLRGPPPQIAKALARATSSAGRRRGRAKERMSGK